MLTFAPANIATFICVTVLFAAAPLLASTSIHNQGGPDIHGASDGESDDVGSDVESIHGSDDVDSDVESIHESDDVDSDDKSIHESDDVDSDVDSTHESVDVDSDVESIHESDDVDSDVDSTHESDDVDSDVDSIHESIHKSRRRPGAAARRRWRWTMGGSIGLTKNTMPPRPVGRCPCPGPGPRRDGNAATRRLHGASLTPSRGCATASRSGTEPSRSPPILRGGKSS